MGPHSDECGILHPRAEAHDSSGLQWGRTLMSAESPDVALLLEAEPAASMGPHSDECGIRSPPRQHSVTAPGFNGAAL